MTDVSTYHITGPASPNFSRVARLSLSAIASEVDADIEGVDDVRLVVSELINVALDSKAKTIDLAITPVARSIQFELRGMDCDEEVTNDLSLRIFDALVDNLNVNFENNVITISGMLAFSS